VRAAEQIATDLRAGRIGPRTVGAFTKLAQIVVTCIKCRRRPERA
jgi:hypothetical protein